MTFLVATCRKDLARWFQDRSAILLWLGIPFMIGGLLTLMMSSNDSGGPMGTVFIADLDESLASGVVTNAFSQGDMADLLGVQKVSVEEGTALIEDGQGSGFLIIPQGFQDAFINETEVTLTLKTNPSQTILPGIIEDVTSVLLDAGFYLQAAFGKEIAEINDATELDSPTDLFVSAMAVQIQDKMEVLGPQLSEPLLDIEIVQPPPAEPRPDLALLFLPGIALMALMFSAQSLAGDYWVERDSGTLRRLSAAPALLNEFVFGKAFAAGAVAAFIGALTLAVGFWYHDVSWAKFLPSVVWLTLAGVGLFAWFAALQMMLPTAKSANLLSTIIIFPLLMMGGSFFPLEVLPDWLSSIGRLAPNGFVVQKLGVEFTSVESWTFGVQGWGVLIAMAVSGLFLCSWRLHSGFASKV